MKKVLAIVLSILMILSVMPMALASSDYNRDDVSANKTETIDNLSTEQIAGILLDWVDRKINAVSEEFASFDEQLAIAGMSVPTNLDGIISYKDHAALLGGDFANLDTSALTTRTEAGSDLQFIYNVISFMAANSDTFAKVFAWEEGQTFDFGKVGEYITNPDNNVDEAVVNFYNDYLIGGNIQEKFVNEIAREMDYTIKEGETFDEVIDNGIKQVAANFLSDSGLISDSLKAKIMAADDADYNLKTTDVYTLIKKLFADIQADKWDNVTTYFTYLCDNVIRPILKASFGYTVTTTSTAAPSAVLEQFCSAYNLEKLAELAGNGSVLFQAADGKYYSINVDGLAGYEVTYGESFLNFEAPTVEIGDKNTVIGTYTPTNPDTTSYQPTVYTSKDYSEYIGEDMLATADEFGVKVTAEALPQEIADIIAAGDGVAMQDEFKMAIKGKVLGNSLDKTIEITFDEIEAAANEVIASKLSTIQETVDPVVAAAVDAANKMPVIGGSITGGVTINSITVKLGYTGYSDEDTFICEVSVEPTYDITYTGNIWQYASMIGMTTDKIEADYIQPVIDETISNPVATIVVDNLNGTVEGMDSVTALMDYVDTDFDVDTSILDFASKYDQYKGFVGQMNRLLCDVVDMVLSDDGYASLNLTEGGNENLTENIEKICEKTDALLSAAKQYMDANDFAAFADAVNLDSIFASEHGFNANMLYNLDFSSVENLYVCAIRMGCDLLVKDEEGLLYDIHMIVEDLDTLEQIAVGIFNYAMPKLASKINETLAAYNISVSFAPTKDAAAITSDADAKDYILTKLVDMVYDAAVQAVPAANNAVNDLIAKTAEENGIETYPRVEFELDVAKGANYSETLSNLVNRVYELTDGIFRDGVLADASADVYAKISALANNFLPLGSMLSNAGVKGANGSIDVSYILSVLFDECLAGNFDNFLRMFEVKEDELAGTEPVTYVLIKASKHIVDSVFPGTVVPENTPASETCQETFTSSANDVVIASNNMKSINTYKEELVPAVLNLIREAGVLPYFAQCDNHVFGDAVTVAGTCVTRGTTTRTCTVCGYKEVEDLGLDPTNHVSIENVDAVEATCTTAGSTAGSKCTACGVVLVESKTIPAKDHHYSEWKVSKEATCSENGIMTRDCLVCGNTETKTIDATGNHVDNNSDGLCDTCGKRLSDNGDNNSFIARIRAFFQSIIDWFRNLFKIFDR